MARLALFAASLLPAEALWAGEPPTAKLQAGTRWVTHATTACQDALPLPQRLYSKHRLLLLPQYGAEASATSETSVRVTYEPEGVCALLQSWSSPRRDGTVSLAERAFAAFCEDCREHASPGTSALPGCPRRAKKEGDGLVVELPPAGGCVHIDRVPLFHPESPGAQLRWEQAVDALVLPRALGGLALVVLALPLSQSALVHALLGGSFFLLLVSALFCWWMLNRFKEASHRPFAVLSLAIVPALLAFTPLRTGANWWDQLHILLGWQVAGLPLGQMIVAVLCAAVVGFVLFGANLGRRYLASPPEPLEDVPFVIGSDGRRIDELPAVPLQQQLLSWLLWVSGVVLIAKSTQHPSASLMMAALAVLHGTLLHWMNTTYMAYEAAEPGHFRKLLTMREYEEQGKRHRDTALNALARHIRANGGVLERLSDATERHARRFSNGGPHIVEPLDTGGASRCGCALL